MSTKSLRQWVMLTMLSLVLWGCGGDDECDQLSCSPIQMVASGLDLRYAPRVAAAADGTLWMVWMEGVPGGEEVKGARVSASGRVSPFSVARTFDGAWSLQIVIAGSTPIVTWLEWSGGTTQVRVVAWNGGQWVGEYTRSLALGNLGTSLLATPAGEAHLILAEYDFAGTSRFYSSRRIGTGSWSPELMLREVPQGSGAPSGLPKVAADDAGQLMAIWAEEIRSTTTTPQPQILWSSRFDLQQGAWLPAVQADAGDRYVADLVASGPGEWVLAWRGGGPLDDSSVRAKRFRHGVWEAVAHRIDTDAGDRPREVALTKAGRFVHVAWATELADTDLRFGVRVAAFDLGSGTSWSVPELVGGPSLSLPAQLNMRSGRDDRVALAWGAQAGPSGPFFARNDLSGRWLPAFSLESAGLVGNAPDLVSLNQSGWAVAWYRWESMTRLGVVLQRMP